jgi:hypothetical protein
VEARVPAAVLASHRCSAHAMVDERQRDHGGGLLRSVREPGPTVVHLPFTYQRRCTVRGWMR